MKEELLEQLGFLHDYARKQAKGGFLGIAIDECYETIKQHISIQQKKLDRMGEIVKEHRDYYVIKSLVEEILKER